MVGEAGPRFTQRPIATPRGLKARAANISRSKKRKSGDGLGPSSVESSAEKKRKTTENDGADWAVITQQHTNLLNQHKQFLSALLKQSNTNTRTTAILSYLTRTNEMMSQVSTLDALNDLHISSNGPSSAQAQANANTTGPEPIIVDAPDFTPSKRKRTAFQSFASPELSPQKTLDGANPSDEIPEGSPVKKLRSADPIMPSIAQVLRRTAAGEYQRKLSVRLAQTKSMKFTSASVSRSQTTTTTTQATRTQSAPGVKMEVLVEKDDIYEEVQKRLREKRNNEHKLVEGNEKKRRRRSSTNSKEREDGERHKRLRVVSIPRVKPHRRSTSASGTGSLENRGRERSRF